MRDTMVVVYLVFFGYKLACEQPAFQYLTFREIF